MERIIVFIHIRIVQEEWMDEHVGEWIFYNIINKIYHFSVLKNPSLGLVTCLSRHRIPLDSNLSSKESTGTSCSWKTIHFASTHREAKTLTPTPIPLAHKPLTSQSYTHSLPGVGAAHLRSYFLYSYPPRFLYLHQVSFPNCMPQSALPHSTGPLITFTFLCCQMSTL